MAIERQDGVPYCFRPVIFIKFHQNCSGPFVSWTGSVPRNRIKTLLLSDLHLTLLDQARLIEKYRRSLFTKPA